MKAATVEIGGRSYAVEALPIRKARTWRQALEERMGGALAALLEVSTLALQSFETPDDLLKGATNVILQRFAEVFTTLIRSSDLVAECAFDFSPALAGDRDWIEEHGTDEEMTRAFIQILGLAYPFGSWAELARSLGAWARSTRTSSVDPSSDSGPMNSVPKSEPVS
jgi:hypothetical protein